jgi:PKD repeat protein
MALNDSLTGRLHYKNVSSFDNIDWYKVTIPDDGSLTFTVKCESPLQVDNLRIFDKDTATQISSGSYGGLASVSYLNLTAGTYYVSVPFYAGYGSYVVKNSFTPANFASDSYSNNDINHAQLITVNDSITGRLYYKDKASFDTQDWYMLVLPRQGNVTFSVYTTNGLQVDNLRIFDKDKTSQIGYGSYGAMASVSISQYKKDTLYFYVPYYTGYGSYVLKTNYLPAPIAEFTVFQNLYDIATTNSSKNATSYAWDFGDGITSDLAYAKHLYATPGTFNIQLIVSNAAGKDTAKAVVEILGIKDFAPLAGGNTGDVTLTIHGGGFRETSKCWIEKEGVVISPDTTVFVEMGVIRGTFNLREKPVGLYDVCVKLENGSILKQTASFTLEEGRKAEPWVTIVGRDKILYNRWQTYTINYGNSGNVDATGVPLWVLLPRGDGIEIDFSALKMSLPETDDTVWQMMLDSIPIYMDIEMFAGEPYSGRLYPLFIPTIPAGETFTLKFKIKTPHNIEMSVLVSPPYFQSPVNPDVASCIRWAQMKAVANGLVNIINEQLPGVACASGILQSIYGLTYGDPQPITSHLWQISRSTFTCAAEFFGPLKAYKLSVAVLEL